MEPRDMDPSKTTATSLLADLINFMSTSLPMYVCIGPQGSGIYIHVCNIWPHISFLYMQKAPSYGKAPIKLLSRENFCSLLKVHKNTKLVSNVKFCHL